MRAIQVRLRFIGILFVAFLVVGRWDDLRNRWDRLARWVAGSTAREEAVSADTEYFCPMDPGVVSDWPGKCSICNMALVRRKKGEAVPLPDGVVSRMQFSPYRLQLAGIRTSAVAYQPLARETEVPGVIKSVSHQASGPAAVEAECEVSSRDQALLGEGLAVEVRLEAPGVLDSRPGKVKAVSTMSRPGEPAARVLVTFDTLEQGLEAGMGVIVRIRRPIDRFEPFRSLPADPPPFRKGERRSVFVCPDHPDSIREKAGRCPLDGNELEEETLRDDQRLRWWCPMHPNETADRAGKTCKPCGDVTLVPRLRNYRPKGQVLAVPECSVVDTGTRTVVFVERMPGMFEGVEVVLGPRCGEMFPVVRGLAFGDRVASSGAFLIDAETRLNPGVASAYFGSGTNPRPSSPRRGGPGRVGTAPDTGAPEKAPKGCPVSGKPLGSMGPPYRVVIDGKPVDLCCEGCEARLRSDPKKYLGKRP